jgi:hypothetical protein
MLKKTKNDAGKTLGERTKKKHDTPRAQQVGYNEHKEQPLSETSYTHRNFFGVVAPPSFACTQVPTDKKCYN